MQDAFFAPTTKTPYTDELQFGYEVDLGNSMSVEATYYNRKTRDILEDYDLELYATAQDRLIDYPRHDQSSGLAVPRPRLLRLRARTPARTSSSRTLAGGERNAQGLEFVFRKRFERNWQMLGSYNYLDADGNTNSDSNADFQGDVIYLDPRAPNQSAPPAGDRSGTCSRPPARTQFPFGLQLGAMYRWNSGTAASRTFLASSRNLPDPRAGHRAVRVRRASRRGGSRRTRSACSRTRSWGQVDLRAQYVHRFGRMTGEFFVDLFNVTDTQTSIREQDLVAGQGDKVFGDEIQCRRAARSSARG